MLDAVLGRVPALQPAEAPGWRVAALLGHPYPGLVAAEGSAAGAVIADLSPAEWDVVDDFEGAGYYREVVTTRPYGDALAYVVTDRLPASAEDWDRDRFAARDLAAFVAGCVAWRGGYR